MAFAELPMASRYAILLVDVSTSKPSSDRHCRGAGSARSEEPLVRLTPGRTLTEYSGPGV
jgi:hypothetical protein